MNYIKFLKKDKSGLTSDDIQARREKEQETMVEMMKIYCHGNHGTKGDCLCPDCKELLEYSNERSRKCPFMETKTFCSNCEVHCYKPEMRARIKDVMRYAGPRMLFHHPLMAIAHLVLRLKTEKERVSKSIYKN